MSLRWRSNGTLICGAKSDELEDDCYIDDRLHYHLSVELNIVVPDNNEEDNGLWYWVDLAESAKSEENSKNLRGT